jgi:hypothetical protein
MFVLVLRQESEKDILSNMKRGVFSHLDQDCYKQHIFVEFIEE